jgi:hypothetical protein
LKYLRLKKHRHVTTHTIAPVGYGVELCDHGVSEICVEVIKLEGVGPTGKVWVPPERHNSTGFYADPTGRILDAVGLRAFDKKFRMGFYPCMILPHVVRNKIEDEF